MRVKVVGMNMYAFVTGVMSVSCESISKLFDEGRTHHGWLPRPVSEDILRKLYELMKWPPTCVNGAPARIVFLRSKESKEKLLPCLMEKNKEKTKVAPITAIIAYDLQWSDHLPKLFPQADYRSMYANNPELNEATAFRNSSLQAGYFILAARSLGLDVGPMSGFNLNMVNSIFFKDAFLRVNFLCNLGYGDSSKLYPRGPRLSFEEVCSIM
jgi:3-hydroxypropanoate dehydrogenase